MLIAAHSKRDFSDEPSSLSIGLISCLLSSKSPEPVEELCANYGAPNIFKIRSKDIMNSTKH